MAFIDETDFFAEAGKGGNGVVRWRREKYEDRGGPWGGDGGKGGDVYVEGVRNIAILKRLVHIKRYKAENGFDGQSASKHGKNGKDVTIMLPEGSLITNTTSGETFELLQEGQKICILRGGSGGYGNEHFKSSTNQSPDVATHGVVGEKARFHVELRLIAHAGLVGFPNAGKSSLLNALTNAGAKVGDYPFTTLSPNLGAVDGYVIADIPGLIEDASSGKGLGIKFLRHISRTKVIIHCISSEQDNVLDSYKTIRKELIAYGQGISEKTEIIFLTKKDLYNKNDITQKVALLKKDGLEVLPVTVLDDASILEARTIIRETIEREMKQIS